MKRKAMRIGGGEGSQKRSSILGIILTSIWLSIIPLNAVTEGADWRFYNMEPRFADLYDAESISHPAEGISRVWTMTVCLDKWKCKDFFRELKMAHPISTDYERWDYGLSVFEARCGKKEYRILLIWNLDGNDETIDYFSLGFSQPEWSSIDPEDVVQDIYRIVCP